MDYAKSTLTANSKLQPEIANLLDEHKGLVFTHTKWESTALHALTSISYTAPGYITAVVGPSGVGKSRLLRELRIKLDKTLSVTAKSDIPVMYFELKAPEEGPFSWKDLYLRILAVTNPPLADEVAKNPFNLAIPGKKANTHELRRHLEDSLRCRKTKIVILDEIQHIALGRMATSMLLQLDNLKSFSDMSGVHLIVGGPYQLLRSVELSAQLARRIKPIHFQRYMFQSKTEMADFRDVLCDAMESFRPWEFSIDPEENLSYFYQRSVGCFGMLIDWLRRAVERSATGESYTVSKEHLDAVAHHPKFLRVMLSEMMDGEEYLKNTPGEWAELDNQISLGFNGSIKSDIKPARKLLPGEAAPRRYPNGDRP